jgi:hypothetical protein
MSREETLKNFDYIGGDNLYFEDSEKKNQVILIFVKKCV